MRRTLVILAVFALVLAACGGGGTTSAPGTVQLGETSLGQVLVNSLGRTLYGFTPDVGQAAPTCVDTCVSSWPPLTATGPVTAGPGVDQSKLKTIQRADGTTQVQYGDYPLYHYITDQADGLTTGQGRAGNWFVIGADGQLIQ